MSTIKEKYHSMKENNLLNLIISISLRQALNQIFNVDSTFTTIIQSIVEKIEKGDIIPNNDGDGVGVQIRNYTKSLNVRDNHNDNNENLNTNYFH